MAKKIKITEEARELHRQFMAEYGYIAISVEVAQQFLEAYRDINISTDQRLDYLRDFVLSQGLEDEVEL